MLRVLWSELEVPAWVLTEDEFLNKINELEKNNFAQAPPGRVSVEEVDEEERVQFRAYYAAASGLAILATQIREGRAALARRNPPGAR